MDQEELMQQLQTAVQAYQGRSLDVAENIFKQILEVNPKEPNALHLLGCIYKDRGKLQQAVDLIQASIQEDDSNPIPFLNLGKIFAIADQHENAAGVFQESLKRNQQIPESWFCFGNALKELEKTQESIQAFRNALQLNPAHVGAAGNLGALLTDEEKLDEAESILRKALETNPEDINCLVNLGNVLKREGEVEEAIASYRKAIEVKADFVDALSLLASELIKREGYEEAISLYKRALEEDPEHVNSSVGLGWCFIKSGRLEEAIAYYSNLLQMSPSNTDALFFLFEAFKGELQVELNREFSYSANFLDKCLKLICVSKIVAFGDSHVQLFEGRDEIEVNHVGASTAYNLVKENSSTGGRQQVLNRVKRMHPDEEAVLLCFGEVDIRANVIKYCYLNGFSVENCVADVVSRYIAFAAELASRGFKILIYGGYGAGNDRISVGSIRERNYAVKCLNSQLSQRCEENGFVYFSLHDALFDEECLETDSSFLSDGFHLHSDELGARGEVQILLFERAYKAAKALLAKPEKKSTRDFVLGNVGSSNSLRSGFLVSDCLSWEGEIDSLESVVFDLGAAIRFWLMTLELDADLEIDRLSVFLDGHLVDVQVVQEAARRWQLRPAEQSVPFIGRHPMLKAPSDLLLSIKGFSVKEQSLV